MNTQPDTPAVLVNNPQPGTVPPAMDRRLSAVFSVAAGIAFIAILTLIIPADSRMATMVLDRHSRYLPFPLTIQNLEHLLLFLGLGELLVRWRTAERERRFLKMRLLPEDEETVLQPADLGPIRRRVAHLFTDEQGFLPALIDISVLQFQGGRSVDQTVAVMNSSLELMQHRVDMRYTLVRYIGWLIPTLGFIGTVIGLGSALGTAGMQTTIQLREIATSLGTGFDTTLVALVESALLVGFLHIVQEREEMSLNMAGSYTLRNLINRLYEGRI